VKAGIGRAIITINGFLNQHDDTSDEWKDVLDKRFGSNPWYHLLTWESKRLRHLGQMVAPACTAVGIRTILARAATRASKKASRKLSPLASPVALAGLLKNPWHVALVKSKQTGALLADILSRVEGDHEYVLIGHSLGCSVIFSALSQLAMNNCARVSEVHLLGGAVGKHPLADWEKAAQIVAGSVRNYHSARDDVLKRLYPVGTLFTKDPIGYAGIGLNTGKVIDHDVSEFVDGHCSYKKNAVRYMVQ
jgi:hypothetical protein